MIRIKDYIFNENEIEYIKNGTTFKENGTSLLVKTNGLNVKTKKKDLLFEDATFDDIEWNYEQSNIKKNTPSFKGFEVKDEEIIYKEDNKIEKLKNYISCGWCGTCMVSVQDVDSVVEIFYIYLKKKSKKLTSI